MSEDLQNLADHVKARRLHKDWTQLDVYNQGGPSNSTLTAVEDARTPGPSRSTIRKLDVGLQWESGSARRVLEGGEPTPIDIGESVTPSREDEATFLYRKPDELTNDEWRELIARTEPMVEWEIERALRKRRGR